MKNGRYKAVIEVTNKSGHYLLSGVGFSRLFLKVLVKDKPDNMLWASARTNELGAILDGRSNRVLRSQEPVNDPDMLFQSHFQKITPENQGQIYQELIADFDGNQTTNFLRRVHDLKDNRIRPSVYDPAFFLESNSEYINALAVTPGKAGFDP